ncbi:LCP family protein [Klugiella xanthotipulae]|uniref:LCP family protein n=1 Tax=Klugiella xanthotipulae TaxID=244735 RepID=UPI001FEC46C6|nr:LCP family protein [Klugiella xanthotipulae]
MTIVTERAGKYPFSLVVVMSASSKRASGSTGGTAVRHGRQKRSVWWVNGLKVLAAGVTVVAVSGASVVSYATWVVADSLKPSVNLVTGDGKPPVVNGVGAMKGAINIFLAGTDGRTGEFEAENAGGGARNDVNMLLSVSADHKTATVTSFPRDLMIPIPSCPSEDGTPNYYPEMNEQPLNVALDYGGLACAVLTIQELTGIEIGYAGMIDFQGVIGMTNAVGGVPVCVSQDINDPYTGLSLTKGMHTLQGMDALMFLRSRHGIGDGGDMSRISSQQAFLSSLVREMKAADTLTNPTRLFALAKSTTESLTLSTSLNSIPALLSVAATVKDIDVNKINFVQYPVKTHPYNPNKVAPDYPAAESLIAAIKSGTAFNVTGGTGPATEVEGADSTATTPTTAPTTDGAVPDPAATTPAVPGTIDLPQNVKGQSADEVTCTAGR